MKLDIFTAPNRNSRHWQASEICWEEVLAWMEDPASVKAAGNYVFGRFHGNRRTKAAVCDRCALTLDVDYPGEKFLERARELITGRGIIHTTYSSTPEYPRYRLILPLDRRVSPEEYGSAAAVVMARLGAKEFDPGSVQAERYMFKPSEQAPGYFHWEALPGEPMSADELLADFEQEEAVVAVPAPKLSRTKRNPYEIEGTVGVFNRVYESLDELIQEYSLPYTPAGADRYRLAGASGASGMGPIEDAPGLYYSHHSHDPAYGQTCNAFDLVRLHRFADRDGAEDLKKPVNRRPSYAAMLDLAAVDHRVLETTLGEDFSQDMDDLIEELESEEGDGDDWRMQLSRNSKTLQVKDEVRNWDLIMRNDPAFQVIFRNEMTFATEISGDLPWRALERGKEVFNSADHVELMFHIEREYGFRPAKTLVEDAVRKAAQSREINPLKDYLLSLRWDGKPRMETCLPGVKSTPYTRMVARKCLVAAVARMLHPGIKWDHMLVIYGTEGLGKTFWIDKMSKGWSASLGKLGNKDTLLSLQRSWIVTSDESHMLKKSEFAEQKEFLTRTEDVFRLPYERETHSHRRHCVIWGTTNDEAFLRKEEGNRRFLIVRAEEQLDFDKFTDGYVDQVWAEAVHCWNAGETLFISGDEAVLAEAEREQYMEEESFEGLVRRYLDSPVPEKWDQMSVESRKLWMTSRDDGFEPEGTKYITRVCTAQLWTEALGQDIGRAARADFLQLSRIMKRNPSWELLPGRHRLPNYGPQMVFQRKPGIAEEMEELI